MCFILFELYQLKALDKDPITLVFAELLLYGVDLADLTVLQTRLRLLWNCYLPFCCTDSTTVLCFCSSYKGRSDSFAVMVVWYRQALQRVNKQKQEGKLSLSSQCRRCPMSLLRLHLWQKKPEGTTFHNRISVLIKISWVEKLFLLVSFCRTPIEPVVQMW